MKAFMDKDFLLKNETARRLYAAAETMPIIDYHCHLNPLKSRKTSSSATSAT